MTHDTCSRILCRFDGSIFDPLGRQMAYSETFRSLTATVKTAAEQLCGGRLLCLHEGGYSAPYVPYCGLAVMEVLTGVKTEIEDPFLFIAEGTGGQDLQPWQAAVIDEAVKLVDAVPSNCR